jgi:hypothetical protein
MALQTAGSHRQYKLAQADTIVYYNGIIDPAL